MEKKDKKPKLSRCSHVKDSGRRCKNPVWKDGYCKGCSKRDYMVRGAEKRIEQLLKNLGGNEKPLRRVEDLIPPLTFNAAEDMEAFRKALPPKPKPQVATSAKKVIRVPRGKSLLPSVNAPPTNGKVVHPPPAPPVASAPAMASPPLATSPAVTEPQPVVSAAPAPVPPPVAPKPAKKCRVLNCANAVGAGELCQACDLNYRIWHRMKKENRLADFPIQLRIDEIACFKAIECENPDVV